MIIIDLEQIGGLRRHRCLCGSIHKDGALHSNPYYSINKMFLGFCRSPAAAWLSMAYRATWHSGYVAVVAFLALDRAHETGYPSGGALDDYANQLEQHESY